MKDQWLTQYSVLDDFSFAVWALSERLGSSNSPQLSTKLASAINTIEAIRKLLFHIKRLDIEVYKAN